MMDDGDVDGAEQLLAWNESANRILHAPAARPNDVRLARFEAEDVLDLVD